MSSILWSRRAKKDIKNIFYFIAKDSPLHAGRQVHALNATIKSLSEFPFLGKELLDPDWPNFRELIRDSYRIIYRISAKKSVLIIKIHHCRRADFSEELVE